MPRIHGFSACPRLEPGRPRAIGRGLGFAPYGVVESRGPARAFMGTGRMIISSTHWRRFGLGRQIALVVGLTVAASGCSTIASLDPTGLLGGNSDSSPASQFPADQAAPTTTPDQAAGTTPDLSSIP